MMASTRTYRDSHMGEASLVATPCTASGLRALRRRPSRWALARVSAAMHALPRPPSRGPPAVHGARHNTRHGACHSSGRGRKARTPYAHHESPSTAVRTQARHRAVGSARAPRPQPATHARTSEAAPHLSAHHADTAGARAASLVATPQARPRASGRARSVPSIRLAHTMRTPCASLGLRTASCACHAHR